MVIADSHHAFKDTVATETLLKLPMELGSSLKRDDPFIYFILFLSFLFFCFALNERKRLEHLKKCAFFLVRKQSCLTSP